MFHTVSEFGLERPGIHFGEVTSTFLESGLLILEIFLAKLLVETVPIKKENIHIDKSVYF